MNKPFKTPKKKRLGNNEERDKILMENEALRPCRKCVHYALKANTTNAAFSCVYPCNFRHKSFKLDRRYK